MEVEADELQEGLKALLKARNARNEVVHGLATLPAHAEKLLIATERKAFEEKRWHATNDQEAPYHEHEDVIRELDSKELADVEARTKFLCDSYVRLVKLGELSFRTENVWRHRQKS